MFVKHQHIRNYTTSFIFNFFSYTGVNIFSNHTKKIEIPGFYTPSKFSDFIEVAKLTSIPASIQRKTESSSTHVLGPFGFSAVFCVAGMRFKKLSVDVVSC